MNQDQSNLSALCLKAFGVNPHSFVALPGAGGDRRYYRILLRENDAKDAGEESVTDVAEESVTDAAEEPVMNAVIGVVADNLRESRAFVELSAIFADHGVNVPRVFVHSDDYRYYIERDLGDRSLLSCLDSPQMDQLLGMTLDQLVRMQTIPCGDWEEAVCSSPFSRRQVMWDLNYFKYEFVKNTSTVFDEESLENDFEAFADSLLNMPASLYGFMMRDCQSRNVMMMEKRGERDELVPYFIDYQGGRKGPCLYDAISLLWQAKAAIPDDERSKLLEEYASKFAAVKGIDKQLILDNAGMIALFRTLQVLGAYGFRGLVQKRAHFIESIPGALANLRSLLCDGQLDAYPELRHVCESVVSDCRFLPRRADGRLHVQVFSFSYKKGYPEDLSGNGGGFMFDCRGMHNPGRYDEYKQLTGLDQPVIDFLKERGEIDGFVERCVELVSPTVSRYIARGFSSLQIGFGCTGGRHRSVYSAQNVAERLALLFPKAVIELSHREQGISKNFNL